MRVFLTGATGFIGGHIMRALSARGHAVTCLVRPGSERSIEDQALPNVTARAGQFTQPVTWTEAIADHDVLINSVGIIRESPRSSFDAVHRAAPIAFFEAGKAAGVQKIVQISALGADEEAASQYHLSKRAADRLLAKLGVPFVILRPSLVYGFGDHSMTFFESLVAWPLTLVPGDGQSLLQPIYIDDLMQAVIVAVEREELKDICVDAGGLAPITFDDLLDVLARRLGRSGANKLHVPWSAMGLIARLTDALGVGPISSEELGMLRRGNHGSNQAFREAFGFEPTALQAGLARKPLGQAERWQAMLALVRLPLRLSVAFIWLATGIVSVFFSVKDGYALLSQVGITGPLASLSLFGTAYFEIALGVATTLGWHVRLMGLIQLILMLGFTLILTFGIPELWLHPFGPLTKNIPLMGATLAMIALEER
ncbi:MAG: SDR family oxidoreductase [Gemmataceae bacterium]